MQLRNQAAVFVAVPTILAAGAMAQPQAPTSAIRFETRYLIDRYSVGGALLSSTLSTDPISYDTSASVGRVDITIQARVGILPNAVNNNNFGINRVGGAGSATSGFRVIFTDTVAGVAGVRQGTVQRGLTGETRLMGGPQGPIDSISGTEFPLLDANNELLRGTFAPFRGGFSPNSGLHMGTNNFASNGVASNGATGSIVMSNVVGGRAFAGFLPLGFEGTTQPVGVGVLDAEGNFIGGDFASYFRMTYLPNQFMPGARTITVNVAGQNGRYIPSLLGDGTGTTSASIPIGNQSFSFVVPTPSAAGALIALGLVSRRRRR